MIYYAEMIEYYRAKISLLKKEVKLAKYITELESQLEKYIKVYEESSVLYGEVMDNFNSRSKELEKQMLNMIVKAKSDLNIVKVQAKMAGTLYEKYLRLYEEALRR